jgi:hypothetical protein
MTLSASGVQRVAKIRPPTRNDGRPWWSRSTASGSASASSRARSGFRMRRA